MVLDARTVLEWAEWIAKVGAALAVLGGIPVGIYKGVKWIGRNIGEFVDEKVLPPITKLTSSVDELAERTHENTTSFERFAEKQQDINLKTAAELARIRGHLDLDQ